MVGGHPEHGRLSCPAAMSENNRLAECSAPHRATARKWWLHRHHPINLRRRTSAIPPRFAHWRVRARARYATRALGQHSGIHRPHSICLLCDQSLAAAPVQYCVDTLLHLDGLVLIVMRRTFDPNIFLIFCRKG